MRSGNKKGAAGAFVPSFSGRMQSDNSAHENRNCSFNVAVDFQQLSAGMSERDPKSVFEI